MTRRTLAIASMLCTLATGCATPGPKSGEPPVTSAAPQGDLRDSSVDIAYVLGHSHRRFVAWAKGETYGGQTLLDHQIMRESGIDRSKYSEFFGKVEQFVNAPRRKPAEASGAGGNGSSAAGASGSTTAAADDEDACRSPFTVVLRVGSTSKSIEGCRGADDGTLARLVRDGEFLLYSNP